MKVLMNCTLVLLAVTSTCAAQTTTGNTASITPEHFIQQAAIGGIKEVATGNIAQQKSQDAKIKAYGMMMTTDHSQANQELMALAKSKNIQLPQVDTTGTQSANTSSGTTGNVSGTTTNMSSGNKNNAAATTTSNQSMNASMQTDNDSLKVMRPEDVKMAVQQLNALQGKDFDVAYAKMMVDDHKNAIALFEKGTKAADPDVKAFAAKHLPTLKSHLTQIKAIKESSVEGMKQQSHEKAQP
jgi:putative membrane protein